MKRLQWLMSRYTGYVGVTNHMGAKFEATHGFVPAGARGAEAARPALCRRRERAGLQRRDRSPMRSVSTIPWSVCRSMRAIRRPATGQLESVAKERGAAIGVATRQARHHQAARRMGRQARRQGHRARARSAPRCGRSAKLNRPSMTDKERLPYRPCVGVMLLNARAASSSDGAPTAATRRRAPERGGRCRKAASMRAKTPRPPRGASLPRKPAFAARASSRERGIG